MYKHIPNDYLQIFRTYRAKIVPQAFFTSVFYAAIDNIRHTEGGREISKLNTYP